MNWQNRRRSGNVEDQRRGGGGRRLAIGGIGGGVAGVVGLILYLVLGGDPAAITQSLGQNGFTSSYAGDESEITEHEKEMGEFVSVVLADIEDVWNAYFEKQGADYREPKLVLFSGEVDSACGYAGAAVGPFYCPGDEKIYLDLAYFEDMQRELGAPGDFALAYVVAHEAGHHIQKQLGIMEKVDARMAKAGKTEANQLSVRLELQADFLAGVWAHYARKTQDFIDEADIAEGLNAASAVGDDRIMKQSQGYVVPDAFTHGSSAMRVRWFKKGLETGDLREGDTFSAAQL